MWGSRQYICVTKNIICLSVENPPEKKCFPQKLDTLDCIHYSYIAIAIVIALELIYCNSYIAIKFTLQPQLCLYITTLHCNTDLHCNILVNMLYAKALITLWGIVQCEMGELFCLDPPLLKLLKKSTKRQFIQPSLIVFIAISCGFAILWLSSFNYF